MTVALFVVIALVFIQMCLVSRQFDCVNFKLEKIMAEQENFESVLNRIDDATNNVAADLRRIKDMIEGQGLPASVEDQILARLENAASKLEAVAAEMPEEPEQPEEPGEGNEE